jgi:hypothetical protein
MSNITRGVVLGVLESIVMGVWVDEVVCLYYFMDVNI